MYVDSWTDRTSGLRRHKTMIQAESVRLIDSKVKPQGSDPAETEELACLPTELRTAPAADEAPVSLPLPVSEPAAQAEAIESLSTSNQLQAKRKASSSRRSKSKPVGSAS
jgi:hypothetical protein